MLRGHRASRNRAERTRLAILMMRSARMIFIGATIATLTLVVPRAAIAQDEVRVVDEDRALDRFWREAERILDGRLGHIAQINDDDGPQVTVAVGAVDISQADEEELREAAPLWVSLDTFETRYSLDDLERFQRLAREALEEEGLGDLFTGTGSLDRPDHITIYVERDTSRVREVLNDALPDDVFSVSTDSLIPTALTENPGRAFLIGVIALAVLGVLFALVRRRLSAA